MPSDKFWPLLENMLRAFVVTVGNPWLCEGVFSEIIPHRIFLAQRMDILFFLSFFFQVFLANSGQHATLK
jgi:hypothetical protein